MTRSTIALSCRELSATLGRRPVLHRIDLVVDTGEWVGLIGPNGAGKSTLLRSIARLVDHEGSIELADGRRPGATDVALVPQQPTVPDGMTVAEYVLLARTAHLGAFRREGAEDLAITATALERLDLGGFAERLVSQLSGGELQRVVVARALAQQAPILLLDEPTSALDVGHQTAVLELIEQLRAEDGFTVIAAMHDLTVAARHADRLILLDEGRVRADGPPGVVLDADLLSAVYSTPLVVRTIDDDLVVLSAPRTEPKGQAK